MAASISSPYSANFDEGLRAVADNLPNGLIYQVAYDMDGATRFLYVSDAVERLNGVTAQEVLEDSSILYRQILPVDLPKVDAAEQRSLDEGTVLDVEFRSRIPSGQLRWFQVSSAPRKLEEGRTVWDGVQIDVTDRKRNEILRDAQREVLRLVLEDAPLENILDCIGAVLQRWDPETVSSIVLGDDSEQDAICRDSQHSILSRDGSRIGTVCGRSITGQPLTEDHETLLVELSRLASMAMQRIEADRALERSENRFRELVASLDVVVWEVDWKAQCFSYISPQVEGMFGHAPQFWGDFSLWTSLVHPDDRDRVNQYIDAQIAEGRDHRVEYRALRADGKELWVEERVLVQKDQAGNVDRLRGVFLDVTARKEIEHALIDAARHKDQFLAMLAHELRNPLAPVKNAVEVCKRVEIAEPKVKKACAIIDRQITHMAALVDDLLDVARIAGGKTFLRREPTDLAALVRATTEDYRNSIDSAGIQLVTEVTEGALWVDGDSTRLAQMIGNLLHNSSKFTDVGGTIRVQARADPITQAAVVSVTDNGIGMDEKTLARVFDIFAQGEQGLERSHGGLGLGLALVRGLAELHGGSVVAGSGGIGRGATFTFRVPLSKVVPIEEPARAQTRFERENFRVLVIEDNVDSAESIKMLLELSGHTVEMAHDGLAGIQVARSFDPHLVICDIGLPDGMSGYDVARVLREMKLPGIKRMIALTGYGREEDLQQTYAAGFDLHFTKPVDFDTLIATVDELKAADEAGEGCGVRERRCA